MGILWVFFVLAIEGKVTIYPKISQLPKFTAYSATADGQALELFAVKTALYRSWPGRPGNLNRADTPVAMFDTDGPVEIVITRANTQSVVVRPSRQGVKAVVTGDTITFTLEKTGQYSVEFNGATQDALMLFSNPPMEAPPTDPVTSLVLDAGLHAGYTLYPPITTLFLMPGCLIRGKIVFESNNSRIAGRGIIDGSQIHDWENGGGTPTLPIEDYGHTNISIDGISIFDPDGWTIQIQKTQGATLNNVKIISSRQNSDGFSLQSSQHVTIKNSFVRSADDAIVLKNYGSMATMGHQFVDDVVWVDFAQGLEIGVETNSGYDGQPNPVEISNITYERIDILHAFHKAPISIHNGDGCDVHDISYNDIVIEDAQMGQGDGWNYLIDFANMNGGEMGGDPGWTHHDGPRKLRNVSVRNVTVLGGNSPGARIGNGNNAQMDNVTISGVTFQGQPLDMCTLGRAPTGVTCS